jgi:L-threonylcarbamoyladenylate synthase
VTTGFEGIDIPAAARVLRSGGVVAFPTETVYGLGADARSESAVARVFTLKGRPSTNPLIVHVTGREMASQVAAAWPDWAEKLAREFWPGPLTIVLPRHESISLAVTAGGPTVAIRSPDHPTALALLFEFGAPLVGPSANRSGRVSPTTAAHVRDAFTADEVVILDGGPCSFGIESTVVRMHGGKLEILRPGLIGPSALAHALTLKPDDVIFGPQAGNLTHAPSPGLLAEHYAPRTPAVLFDRPEWSRVLRHADSAPITVVSFGSFSSSEPHAVIQMPGDPLGYAAELYSALRAADATAPGLIAIERPPLPARGQGGPDAEVWLAIADRLGRAARPL